MSNQNSEAIVRSELGLLDGVTDAYVIAAREAATLGNFTTAAHYLREYFLEHADLMSRVVTALIQAGG